jgi:acetyl-CoA acyltransferase 1
MRMLQIVSRLAFDSFHAEKSLNHFLKPMGWTSEIVALDYSISRQKQDEYALLSVTRASNAQKSGKFAQEILPILARPPPDSSSQELIEISKDDGIRHDTTLEGLAKLRSAFPDWGNAASTGGNSSQVTDGVAALLLMRRDKAQELGLRVVGKYVGTVVVGVKPRVMGIGPIDAIKKGLDHWGLDMKDVDLWEVRV